MSRRAKAQMQSEGAQVAEVFNMPAPTSGWYVGDNQAAPPPKTAIVLNNAFPQLDYVRVRGGSQNWASGMGSFAVSTLMPWVSGVASKFFAVCNKKIYDISSSGAVGAAVVTGLANSFLQFVQFSGFGGSYLVAVDGADPVQIFDGTGWNRTFVLPGTLNATTTILMASTANLQVGMALSGTNIPAGATIASINPNTSIVISIAATGSGAESLTFYQNAPITGYSGAGFSSVAQYRGHLYFVDAQTLNVYYLALAAIGGPATIFPLAPFCLRGGYVIAMAQWSVNSGVGQYLGFVFITSEGEVLLYNGANPGDTSWTLVGQYKIAKPVGPRCTMPAGGDLLIMTEDGIVPMSKVMTLDQVALENVAVTKPIAPAWRDAVIARAGIAGWQIVPWPLQSMTIINLPKQSASDFTQFIANSRTGAWAQYLGWDANCFGIFNDNMFYGDSAGNVWQGETGGCDAGMNNYTTTVMMAFSYLGRAGAQKQIVLVKPYFLAAQPVTPQIMINVEFSTTIPPAPNPSTALAGALWDVARWDQAVWSGALVPYSTWQDAQGEGVAIGVVFQLTTNLGLTLPDQRISAFDVAFQEGNVLG